MKKWGAEKVQEDKGKDNILIVIIVKKLQYVLVGVFFFLSERGDDEKTDCSKWSVFLYRFFKRRTANEHEKREIWNNGFHLEIFRDLYSVGYLPS